jgi:hypothetical protein
MFELDGLPVRGDGLVGLAQPTVGDAEIVVRYGVILIEPEGPLVLGNGLV